MRFFGGNNVFDGFFGDVFDCFGVEFGKNIDFVYCDCEYFGKWVEVEGVDEDECQD